MPLDLSLTPGEVEAEALEAPVDFRWYPVFPVIFDEVEFRVKAHEELLWFAWCFEDLYWWDRESGQGLKEVTHSWETSSVWVPDQDKAFEVILFAVDRRGRLWEVRHRVQVLPYIPALCSPEHVTLEYLDSIKGISKKEARRIMEALPVLSLNELAIKGIVDPKDLEELQERVRPCYSPFLPRWPFD